MRKIHLYSAVLSLFLLVPASIIWAQVTKTLNGTVTYRSGMSETRFTTANGDVVVHLPQSLAGSVITGTVSTEPAGKTEKEKNKNLKELVKLVVNLDGQKIPLSENPSSFDWLTHMDRSVRTPMELFNVSGNKIGAVSFPRVLSPPAIVNPGNVPHLSTPSNILVKGDVLNIYTDQQFIPGEKFVLKDARGQQFTVKPICQSADQAVIKVPEGVVIGELTAIEEVWNHPAYLYESSITVRNVDIQLSSPNTNLRPGQKSEVLAIVIITDSSGGWTSPDLADLLNTPLFSIDLRNLNPNTVTMEGGNLQRVNIGSAAPVTMGIEAVSPAAGRFEVRRMITGNTVGSFSVSATLHEDMKSSNDLIKLQIDMMKTAEQFNAWSRLMKNDLLQYSAVQNFRGGEQVMQNNIQRAIDNMPAPATQDALEEAKAVARSLLRPLNIPKGAASTWASSLEAFKAALQPLNESGTDPISLPDRDMINNGLEFIQRIAHRTNDQSMINEIVNLRSTGGADAKAGDLQTLIAKTEEKLENNPGQTAWKLSDLAFSTYCFDKRKKGLDPMKSMVGHLDPERKLLMVTPEYQQKVLSSLNAVPLGANNYRINAVNQTMTSVNMDVHLIAFDIKTIFDGDWWAEYLIKEILQKDTSRGKIITTTRDSTGTYYVFYKDAKCQLKGYAKEDGTSDCIVDTEWDTKEQKSKPTGYYKKITCYKGGECAKGTEFCTEAYVVTCITQYFLGVNCTQRYKTVDSKHFSCL